MNVIDEVKKRMKSNGVGAGSGLRNGMTNVVHRLPSSELVVDGGNVPRRANNYVT